MAKVTFCGRYDRENIESFDVHILEDIILNEEPMGGAWGDATIKYEDDEFTSQIIVLSDKSHGFYLNYSDESEVTFLSLSDRSALEVVICPDDWEASLGLFLGRMSAFNALFDFIKTGRRSQRIEWISENDMPEGSNW